MPYNLRICVTGGKPLFPPHRLCLLHTFISYGFCTDAIFVISNDAVSNVTRSLSLNIVFKSSIFSLSPVD